MNKTTICAVAAAMLLLFGCDKKTTGLVFVDYDTAEKNGIIVTNFTDSPLYATVLYDYSKIKDFDPSCLEVTLAKTVIPLEEWTNPNADLSKYSDRQIKLQKKLCSMTTVDEEPIVSKPDRKATVKVNVPGKLKIFSLDDLGAYKIEYKPKSK